MRGPSLQKPGDDPIGDLHGQLHAGMDPMQMAMALAGGPRGLRLTPGKNIYGSSISHTILNNDKTPLAEMEITPRREGKDLWVEGINSFPKNAVQASTGKPATQEPNAIGPGSLRTIIPQLMEMYPNAERLGGYRVSGARDKAGAIGRAWLNFRRPVDEASPISGTSADVIGRWRDIAREHIDNQRLGVRNIQQNMEDTIRMNDLSRDLNNPAVTEMTARRNAALGGQTKWSALPDFAKGDFRMDAEQFGAPPGQLPQNQSDAVRNRWLGAQQRAWRADRNKEVAGQMAGDARDAQVQNQIIQHLLAHGLPLR